MAALIIKQLVQVSQSGESLWSTDKTGEYNATDNEGGWGSPNFELNQSAVLVISIRKSEELQFNTFIDAQLKFSPAYTNADELTWNFEYINDGVHDVHLSRLYVSGDDSSSLDGYSFVIGDVWYNNLTSVIKIMEEAGAIRILDLTVEEDVYLLLGSNNIVTTLCENLFSNTLAIKKNDLSLELFRDRRNGNYNTESELIGEQMSILMSIASANYSYSFGLKQEAQRIIESSLSKYSLV